MSARSRSWWAAAVILASAGMWAAPSGGNLVYLWYTGFCSDFEIDSGMWATPRWTTPLRYAALCGLVLALGAHRASVRRGREPGGRTTARVLGAAVLLLHGSGALNLALELGADGYCRAALDQMGALRGVLAVLIADVALAPAALCALHRR